MAIPRSEFRYLAEQKSPIAYLGVNAIRSSNLTIREAAPTSTDVANFSIGDLWINISVNPEEVYILTSITGDTGTWSLLLPNSGSGGVTTFVTDAGSTMGSPPDVDIFGDGLNISTSGTGDTVSFYLTRNVIISGTMTINQSNGLLINNVSQMLTASNGLPGQIIYSWNGQVKWADLLEDAMVTVNIVRGDNSIDLTVAGGVIRLFGDSGFAQPAGGIITMAGGDNITTSGSGNTITVALDNDILLDNITTNNNVTTTVITANGTITASSLNTGIVYQDGLNFASTSSSANGQLLIANENGDPQWAAVTSNLNTVSIVDTSPNNLGFEITNTGTPSAFLAIYTATTNGNEFSLTFGSGASGGNTEIIYDSNGDVTGGGGNTVVFTAPITATYYFYTTATITLTASGAQQFTASMRIMRPGLPYPTSEYRRFVFYSGDTTKRGIIKASRILNLTAGQTMIQNASFSVFTGTSTSSRAKYLGTSSAVVNSLFGGYII